MIKSILKKIPVMVIQRIIPPYRLQFFKKLNQSTLLDVTLGYGDASKISALESVSPLPEWKTRFLKNYYIGQNETLVYQKGFFGLILKTETRVVIAEFNPRIIMNVIGCCLAKIRGIKFIWWGHGLSPNTNWLKLKIRLLLAHLSDAVIFYEYNQAKIFQESGVVRDKIFVAPNSIDTERIDQLIQKNSFSFRKRILYVGRLVPGKKMDVIIRAFAIACKSIDERIVLTIIGEGREKDTVKKLAKLWDVSERVEFKGMIYDEEQLADYFNEALVSVASGNIGLNAIHSLSYGVPLIVSKDEPHGPEIAALEDGVNCVFFKTDDMNELSECIIKLFHNKTEWERMHNDGIKLVREKYSISSMVKSFEAAVQYVTS